MYFIKNTLRINYHVQKTLSQLKVLKKFYKIKIYQLYFKFDKLKINNHVDDLYNGYSGRGILYCNTTYQKIFFYLDCDVGIVKCISLKF